MRTLSSKKNKNSFLMNLTNIKTKLEHSNYSPIFMCFLLFFFSYLNSFFFNNKQLIDALLNYWFINIYFKFKMSKINIFFIFCSLSYLLFLI